MGQHSSAIANSLGEVGRILMSYLFDSSVWLFFEYDQ
jgi:hypothetical protein